MLDSSGQSLGGSFLSRRHSAGDAIRSNSPGGTTLESYPPSTPGHECQGFNAPEGSYCLAHQVFFRSLTPMFSVGTTASLVSIKYKETKGSNLNRYEPQPGARSFRISEDNDDDESHSNNSSASHAPPETTKSTPFVTPTPSTSTSPTSTFSFLSRNSSNHRRKSKTNITKTNSSFVARIVTNSQLAKILVARTSEDTNLFYNCGSNFVWMDAFGNPKEPLSRVVFAKACPTSHDVNLLTRGSDHLDIIIGFSTGDIVWFDPLCNKYGRINKGGIMNRCAITMIKWLQGSESLFMAAFADGSIMVFDKDKEDEAFHPGDGSPQPTIYNEKRKHYSTGTVNNTHFHHHPAATSPPPPPLPVSENPDLRLKVTKPPPKFSAKCNPVSHWKLSNKSCTAFAFSPDCQHVAVVSLDGSLRIINFVHEQLCDIYRSYYGGLTCVAWSPDGRYILTGGQDDLVTIWAFREQRIIARCQGHKSWVTGVAFDPWRCDDKVYRFASVGEDAQLILWDFSVNALHRPKARTSTRLRGASVSSHTGPILPMIPEQQPNIHPVPSKTQVPLMQPTVSKTVHADPCVGVYFREEAIVTTDRRGRVSVWKRPSLSSPSNIPTE